MISHPNQLPVAFPGLTDLASERLGGVALAASDEFFAEKENLLKPSAPIFVPERYTDRGKWMDGWESRRKRFAPTDAATVHDWCIVKLGLAGIVKGVDIDTRWFIGNSPSYASLDACALEDATILEAPKAADWTELLPKSPLKPGTQNLFGIVSSERWTHVRLNIYPDGGVARLRVYGVVVPDRRSLAAASRIDLAALSNGGVVIAASDMFFGNKEHLIMPGNARNMGEGWETRRRRGPGNDWVIVRLGTPGVVTSVEVDTQHFKGNAPDRCSLDCCFAPDADVDALVWSLVQWTTLLPPMSLKADACNIFEQELRSVGQCSHVRLNIFPDGGVSRLRIWGRPVF